MLDEIHIQERVRQFIIDSFLFGDGSLGMDTLLMEDGVIDSTGIIELIAFIEEDFNLVVRDDEIVIEDFDTISHIAKFVHHKLDSQLNAL